MQAQAQATATRVLLVEDNPGDADLVLLSLEEAGAGAFELEAVGRLSDALARVRGSRAPDVILLDLSLPDAVGLEGLRKLNEAAPDVPVVVLTGSDRSLGAAAIQAGAQDYLLKGAADAALVPRALRYAIERHEHAARSRLLATERAARAAAEAARERMSLLAAASMAVSHSLEDRHALASLASVVVPRFADCCAIRTSELGVDAPLWVTVRRDGAGSAALEAKLDALVAGRATCGPGSAAGGARSELYEDVGAGSVPPPWRAALEEVGARSAMVVPIQLNEDVLGSIVLAAQEGRYGADDLAVAEEIGRRAGVAVANCRLYREARLAVVARDEFLSAAAHELRTPVTVLQLKLQQVALKQQASICGTCDRAVPADYVGASRQISRLGQLIESLLDMSCIASGRTKLEHEDLDLRDVARDATARLAELASRNASEVALRCAEPVRGRWDRLALERIFANLLSNALKFGATKPVEVRVSAEQEQAVIEVEDHGIGIAREDVDRIFSQFERAVSSRQFGGLGLGLYITRRLVEQHGGKITVASRLGAGSVFTVRLPRAGVPAMPAVS
jgi:signal transduction histidine kinase/DNA-binding NarL/FixJ family response regulator